MTYLEYCQSFLPAEDYQTLLPYIDERYCHREVRTPDARAHIFATSYNWMRCPDILKIRAAQIYDALSCARSDQAAARNGSPLT